MPSGRTLWDELTCRYCRGVEAVRGMAGARGQRWRGRIDRRALRGDPRVPRHPGAGSALVARRLRPLLPDVLEAADRRRCLRPARYTLEHYRSIVSRTCLEAGTEAPLRIESRARDDARLGRGGRVLRPAARPDLVVDSARTATPRPTTSSPVATSAGSWSARRSSPRTSARSISSGWPASGATERRGAGPLRAARLVPAGARLGDGAVLHAVAASSRCRSSSSGGSRRRRAGCCRSSRSSPT